MVMVLPANLFSVKLKKKVSDILLLASVTVISLLNVIFMLSLPAKLANWPFIQFETSLPFPTVAPSSFSSPKVRFIESSPAALTVSSSMCIGNVAKTIITQIKVETILFSPPFKLNFDTLCIEIHTPSKI